MRIAVFVFFVFCFVTFAQSKKGKLSGSITNKSNGEKLANANIVAQPGNLGAVSDSLGNYNLTLPFGEYKITVSYIGFKSAEETVTLTKENPNITLNIKLHPTAIGQKAVFVTGKKEIFSPATQKLNRISIIRMPTIYSDVLKSVKILPGVTSDNELSSGYNVRGGNYNENLIYLDGFEIYRPFLITQGIEENQSIVNGDLINDLYFNGGTFSARLGDKMSSALELTYKDSFDSTLNGVARTGLLNSGLTLYKRFGKLNLAGAVRYSYPKVFASTLQTTGDYNPTYFDAQLLANYRFTENTNLELLYINAQNKFDLTPTDWMGNFQTGFLDVKEVLLKYSGSNNYSFNTKLFGLKFDNQFSNNVGLSILGSVYSTRERNYKNLASNIYYSSNAWDPNQNQEYLKTQYNYANDRLNLDTYELKSIFKLATPIHTFEAGAEFRYYKFNNIVNESMHELGPDSTVMDMPYNINLGQNAGFPSYSGFVQDRYNFSKEIQAEGGVRILRYGFSNETLISPRFSINYFYSKSSSFNFSSGFYYQPPFIREVSNKEIKNSVTSLKSQRAINFMLTWKTRTKSNADYMVDIYYKKLDNLIPYYIDQLKLIYGSKNNYEGYAQGIDFQYVGDLVPGIKSWIGYSFLETGERLKGSTGGYTRRLLDQRHTIKVFLQDRVKKHPNFQAHVRFLFGSGFLYHPRVAVKNPATDQYYIQIDSSQSWVIPFYFRTDMGLSYKFIFGKRTNLVLVAEVYNIFNKNNIDSYNWYHVFPDTHQPVGVPIIFSGRFFSFDVEYNF